MKHMKYIKACINQIHRLIYCCYTQFLYQMSLKYNSLSHASHIWPVTAMWLQYNGSLHALLAPVLGGAGVFIYKTECTLTWHWYLRPSHMMVAQHFELSTECHEILPGAKLSWHGVHSPQHTYCTMTPTIWAFLHGWWGAVHAKTPSLHSVCAIHHDILTPELRHFLWGMNQC